ncbi:ATP-binding protein [Embleya sp. NPDC059237]|uniref:ATP-binding protein n=1 Tax=Embleya sp. NPDC059237 TaxID=3346784 RepID=UPI0036D1E892
MSVPLRTRTTQWEMPGTDEAVHALRHAVEAELERWGADGDAAVIAALAVSELSANAVAYGGAAQGGLFLRLVQVAGRVRVEVRDHNQELPVVGEGDCDGESGRGLLMLSVLPGTWGVELLGGGGKVIFWESEDAAGEVETEHDAVRHEVAGPVAGHDASTDRARERLAEDNTFGPGVRSGGAVRPRATLGTCRRLPRPCRRRVCGAVFGGARPERGPCARYPPREARRW